MKQLIVILMLFLTTSISLAGVSMKNGNFFIGYTDLFYAGGFEPKIERVYNSKTVYNGIFGWGWGNEYEAYLTVTADGSVIVHEYGGGAENRFSPKAFDAKELNAAVDQILQAAKTLGMFGAEAQYKDYRKKLLEDATHRNNEWEKFIAKGLVKPRELSVGTNLFSSRFSYQVITKLINMYIRTSDSGKIEEFDLHGKLKKIKDRNNNYIMLYHKDDGGLEKIVDNFNRKIFVSLNSNGKIIKIQGENKKETIYQYNDKNDLVYSKDAEGNIYKYKYDEKHNMTEIEYSDNKKMQMTYYPPAQYDNIKSVKDKEGTLTEYVYTIDPKDQGHYSIESKITYPSDSKVDSKERTVASKPVISTAKYEYFTKKRADGTEWTQKMISQVESDKTETTYNEHSGLPLLIKKGTEETAFEYDAKGHVTKKITPWEITQLKYHPEIGKVSRVEKTSKKNKKQTSWSNFEYDKKGNLIKATSYDGKGVALIYDTFGRIKTMVDTKGRRIEFKYNENSKPVEITDPALGSITVEYNNSGDIKKVDSKAGRKIAIQVTSAFQNLLDIIRPAGVTLSF